MRHITVSRSPFQLRRRMETGGARSQASYVQGTHLALSDAHDIPADDDGRAPHHLPLHDVPVHHEVHPRIIGRGRIGIGVEIRELQLGIERRTKVTERVDIEQAEVNTDRSEGHTLSTCRWTEHVEEQ